MASHWYNGQNDIYLLSMHSDRLDAIHRYALNGHAFRNLGYLTIRIGSGAVHIHDNAFRGLEHLRSILFMTRSIARMPSGLFNPFAISNGAIQFYAWPSGLNLNEMFADEPQRLLKTLDIRNVALPQHGFRILTADNFTSLRHLSKLVLINCGIEAIEENAFDEISRTLSIIHLENNWIKYITLRMFRRIFESKKYTELGIYSRRMHLVCTCALIEMDMMLCPSEESSAVACIQCKRIDKNFLPDACNVHRNAEIDRFCLNWNKTAIMRLVNIRMAHADGTLSIQTNFSNEIRIILVKFDGMQGGSCMQRTLPANYKCMKFYKFIERMYLYQFEQFGQAEFILVTAIPILYPFGARPMHSITVRYGNVHRWLCGKHWLCFTAIIAIVGLLAGGICAIFFEKRSMGTKTEEDEFNYNEIDIDGNGDSSIVDYDYIYYYQQANREPEALSNEYI